MLIRAKFEELKPLRYISHLELMELFRRAFRRADLPLAYSQGFNPHIILSLSQPLKVGMTGRGEYFDLELVDNISLSDFIKRINENLPEGIRVLEAGVISENTDSLMAAINTAIYNFQMNINKTEEGNTGQEISNSELSEQETGRQNLQEQKMIDRFLAEDKLIVTRHRRNKKDRELDIRPLIFDGSVLEPGLWSFRVMTGSSGNLRPGELVRALADYYNQVEEIPIINVERGGLYIYKNKEFLDPLDDKVIGR